MIIKGDIYIYVSKYMLIRELVRSSLSLDIKWARKCANYKCSRINKIGCLFGSIFKDNI